MTRAWKASPAVTSRGALTTKRSSRLGRMRACTLASGVLPSPSVTVSSRIPARRLATLTVAPPANSSDRSLAGTTSPPPETFTAKTPALPRNSVMRLPLASKGSMRTRKLSPARAVGGAVSTK